MTTYTVTKGDTAVWSVQFLDPVTGLPAVVTGGTFTLVYAVNRVATTSVLTLLAAGAFWTTTWDSSPADLGNGTWSVLATGSVIPAASGRLRVVEDP